MENIKQRVPYNKFNFDPTAIALGEYSAAYFGKMHDIAKTEKRTTRAGMQIFQREEGAFLGGIDEALAMLRLCAGYWIDEPLAQEMFSYVLGLEEESTVAMAMQDYAEARRLSREIFETRKEINSLWVSEYDQLEIQAMHEGDKIDPMKAVLMIEGPAYIYCRLESPILGIIAHGTNVMTNSKRVVEAAGDTPVIAMADRFKRFEGQRSEGMYMLNAGITSIVTPAMGRIKKVKAVGTNPHALIAIYEGNTVEATLAFARNNPGENVIVLADYKNNCVRESLETARRFRAEGLTLFGVRLDTSGTNTDESVRDKNDKASRGVCPELVFNVRRALDAEGFQDVKIIVSGGFNVAKIELFKRMQVPVDIYGVGSSLLKGGADFTADVVTVNQILQAKVGRSLNLDPNITIFNWPEIEPRMAA